MESGQYPYGSTQLPANMLPDSEESALDIQRYIRVLVDHWFIILFFSIVIPAATTIGVAAIKPTYRATTTILVEPDNADLQQQQRASQVMEMSENFFSTQMALLSARQLVEKVIQKHNLSRHPEFSVEPANLSDSKIQEFRKQLDWKRVLNILKGERNTPDTAELDPEQEQTDAANLTEQQLSSLVRIFYNRYDVEPVAGTKLIALSFEANDPKLAQTVANAIPDVFIELTLDAQLQKTVKANKWLVERLAELKSKVDASEQALIRYREENSLVESSTSLATKKLEDLTTELVTARRARAQIEASYRQIQAYKTSNRDQLKNIPLISRNTLVQASLEKEGAARRDIEELSRRYGAKHPKLLEAKSQLEAIRTTLDHQIDSVIDGVQREYETAVENENAVTAQIDAAKQDMQSISRKSSRLTELQRAADTNRELYNMFFQKSREATETGDLQRVAARVVDPANTPFIPIKPAKGRIIGAGVFAGIALGLVFAFLLDALDRTVRSANEVTQKLAVPLLGILPSLKQDSKSPKSGNFMLSYLDAQHRRFAESMRTIRTGVVLSGLVNPHKVILITSTQPAEGKTTVAMNLAIALGQLEQKVLLIDADMRRPAVSNYLGLSNNAPGLSNLAAGVDSLKKCITHVEGIDIMPAGVIPPNPLELLSSTRFKNLLESLEKIYDRIVVDSAPTAAVSDALILSSYANTVIYVVKADSTPTKAAKNGINRLLQINAPLAGVVLNQVDVNKLGQRMEDYGGYYDPTDYYLKHTDSDSTRKA
ncbi:MAG TPA: polysaccharide biosynthesis tyrosine autokinase [Pseudomonadales bacterium]|nr:polysaccharide biosynthesis tyrosine autokinase [Pseudomonadales bacterium]